MEKKCQIFCNGHDIVTYMIKEKSEFDIKDENKENKKLFWNGNQNKYINNADKHAIIQFAKAVSILLERTNFKYITKKI